MGIIEHEGWRGMVETFAKAGHAWPCKCGGIGLMILEDRNGNGGVV